MALSLSHLVRHHHSSPQRSALQIRDPAPPVSGASRRFLLECRSTAPRRRLNEPQSCPMLLSIYVVLRHADQQPCKCARTRGKRNRSAPKVSLSLTSAMKFVRQALIPALQVNFWTGLFRLVAHPGHSVRLDAANAADATVLCSSLNLPLISAMLSPHPIPKHLNWGLVPMTGPRERR
jgi:hypothetical protein